jgi:hypothetical protein
MRTPIRAAFALSTLSSIALLACVKPAADLAPTTESVAVERRDLPAAPPPAAGPVGASSASPVTVSAEPRPLAVAPIAPPIAAASPPAMPVMKSSPPRPRPSPREVALDDTTPLGLIGPSATVGSGAMGAPPAPARGGAAEEFRSLAPAYAAASIAAGEWNDNANYREFQKWLTTEAALPFRAVDVSHRRFLVVRDEAGRAVPGCEVAVSDAAQRTVTLTTGPSGRALLFPRAEGLGEGLVTATATCAGSSVTRPVPLAANDGFVDLRLPVLRRLPPERTIDVAFILDTTGSMSEEIASVKATIAKVAAGLGEGNVNVRIGLVEYKDRGDAFVTRVHPFATDAKGFAASMAGVSAGGGGDTPESVNEGIHDALTRLDWQAGSVGRFAFLVGDAPPHLDYQQDFSYAADMKTAAHRGIQIFTIAASGMDPLGQVVWRQIAQYTNAANMFVLRGGAGPQSVGGGDPRSSCGGTHQNYSSGNLDALILSKINGELGAIEADPLRIAGLGEDENTKPCDQRVVVNER